MRPILTSGLSLIEVLISLILISLVLLGLDAMLISASELNLKAYYGSLAEQQLQNMTQRLRVGGDLEQQIQAWNQENQAILPQGQGWVYGEEAVYTLKLCWGGGSGRCVSKTA